MDGSDMPVYRTRPLPQCDLKGRFLLPAAVVDQTRRALVSFALAGIRDRGHEGLVFWAGSQHGDLTAFTTVVIPEADHSAQRVFVQESAYGRAVASAKRDRVVLLAQVHSHPGADVRHSDGDDDLIIMPFEGMLSVVVPNYGIGWQRVMEAKVHQFRDRQWNLCSDTSVRRGISVPPILVDSR